MTPSKKVKIDWNMNLDEYVVKLFINGVHQPKADYYTDDDDDAKQTANAMRGHAVIQEDFCKVQSKKQTKKEIEKKTNEHFIYDEENYVSGVFYLQAKESMPDWIEVNGVVYKKQTKKDILAGGEMPNE